MWCAKRPVGKQKIKLHKIDLGPLLGVLCDITGVCFSQVAPSTPALSLPFLLSMPSPPLLHPFS